MISKAQTHADDCLQVHLSNLIFARAQKEDVLYKKTNNPKALMPITERAAFNTKGIDFELI